MNSTRDENGLRMMWLFVFFVTFCDQVLKVKVMFLFLDLAISNNIVHLVVAY